jgi:excinuclease UvrABC nuclease subunit
MKLASKNNKFEEAGRLRDQIGQLQKIQDIALLNKTFMEDSLKTSLALTSSTSTSPNRGGDNGVLNKFNVMRIEGYDISNLGASDMVGSMVVFENKEPNKSQYRKFKIKNVAGQSDVDCLAEMLERRLKHNEWKLPVVILVDGGVPQVNRVVQTIRVRKFRIPVVGIAKGPTRKKNEFILGDKNRDFIKWVNANKNLLIQVRNEAHRFAIKYQRSLRKIE